MDASLQPIFAGLVELGHTELSALITAANSGPQTVPRLLVQIEHATNWKQHRRSGSDFLLQPPAAAIHRADWT
jgi:hypothetical protein